MRSFLVLVTIATLWLLAAPLAFGQTDVCDTSLAYAQAARLRTMRSVARTRMAVLRIRLEAQRAGLVKDTSLFEEGPETEPKLTEVGTPTTLETVTDDAWRFSRLAHRIAQLAYEERNRYLPEPERRTSLGPEIRTMRASSLYANTQITQDEASCEALGQSAQQAAFEAEQAAQLAAVAADQIIGLSDHLRALPPEHR